MTDTIVYTKDDSFYISKFDGSEKRFLIGKNDDKEVKYAHWSPNGKYLGIIISKKYEKQGKLYIIDFGKGNKSDKTTEGIKVISIDTPYSGYFSWASDSSKIAYVATNHANGELTVYAYEMGSKKAKIYFSQAGKNESKLMNFGGYESIVYTLFLKNSRDLILQYGGTLLLYEADKDSITFFLQNYKCTLSKLKSIIKFSNDEFEYWKEANIKDWSVLGASRISYNGRYLMTTYIDGYICDMIAKRIWKGEIDTIITPSWSFDDEYIMSAGLEFDREYDPNTSLVIRSFQTDPVDENIEYFVTECNSGASSWSVPIKDLKLPEQKGDESLLKQFLK